MALKTTAAQNRAVLGKLMIVDPVAISEVSEAADAEFTTGAAHELEVGDFVLNAGIGGATSGNGFFNVTAVPAADKFKVGVATTGETYTSGGTVTRIFWNGKPSDLDSIKDALNRRPRNHTKPGASAEETVKTLLEGISV